MINAIVDGLNRSLLRHVDAALVRRSWFVNGAEDQISERKMIFFHPPKCGGTSIDQALKRLFGGNRVLQAEHSFYLDAVASRLGAENMGLSLAQFREHVLAYALELPGVRYVSGHFFFSEPVLHKHAGEWDFLTVLRNPLARTLSMYYYNRHKTNRGHYSIDDELDDWLNTGEAASAATIFARMFVGDIDKAGRLAGELDSQALLDDVISQATENLRGFSVVGDLDDMLAMIACMKDVYQVRFSPGHENRSPKKDYPDFASQPDHVRERLLRLCNADMQIYEAFCGTQRAV